jgi:hypothetical protein
MAIFPLAPPTDGLIEPDLSDVAYWADGSINFAEESAPYY